MTTLSFKPYTIEAYSEYVLNDSRVKAFISKFKAYQRIYDLWTDLPSEIVRYVGDEWNIENADEAEAQQEIKKTMIRNKEEKLQELIANWLPKEWITARNIDDIAHRLEATPKNLPTYKDLPVILFWRFLVDPIFKQYLLNGTVPLLAGPYFAKEMDLKRQANLVFALFLWLNTDGVHEPENGLSYYRDAVPQSDHTLTSSIEVRREFLERFRDYLHLDLWTASDYAQRHKTGTVLRLRLTNTATGKVVIQRCGETIPACNKLFNVNAATLTELTKEYLSKNGLQLATLGFACHHCEKIGASLFCPEEQESLRFYCNSECFKLASTFQAK